MVVHTEAEFVPMYKDQPLFAEVDQFLRQSGFIFHKFDGVAGRPFKPLRRADDNNHTLGQLLWSDAVYVKDFIALEKLSSQKLVELAVILHIVYESVDLAAQVLIAHYKKRGTGLAEKNLVKLTSA